MNLKSIQVKLIWYRVTHIYTKLKLGNIRRWAEADADDRGGAQPALASV